MSLSSYIKASGKKKLYSYRRRVPSDLIGLWKNDEGKELKEVKKALHTTDKAIAMQRGASENLQFEDKAQRLRNDKHAQDRKSEIEKLEERKLVVQQVTKMLRQENLLPDQQPNISLGSSLSDIEQFSQDVDIAEEILITDLLDEVVDEKQRQNDYDSGRWGRAGYTEPKKPIDLNSQNFIALEMLRGKVSPLSVNPSWKDALDIYLEDSLQNRSPHSRRKYEQRVKRVATELAIYLGDGDSGAGFSEKLVDFSRLGMRGFYTFYKKLHPNNTHSTFNRNLNILIAIFNKAKDIFELNDLGTPFKDLRQKDPALHMVDAACSNKPRRSFTPQELDSYLLNLQSARPDISLIGTLMVLTGCRTMEIAGLTYSEVHLENNIPFLDIKPNHIRRLKTPSSLRKIPLTHQAICAFKNYLDMCDTKDVNKPVFPKYGRDGGMDAVSSALRKIIRHKMGVTDESLVPYSARHTLKQRLRVIQTPLEYQNEILGHDRGTSKSERGYGEGNLLQLLRAELEKAETLKAWAIDSILDSD